MDKEIIYLQKEIAEMVDGINDLIEDIEIFEKQLKKLSEENKIPYKIPSYKLVISRD